MIAVNTSRKVKFLILICHLKNWIHQDEILKLGSKCILDEAINIMDTIPKIEGAIEKLLIKKRTLLQCIVEKELYKKN